MGVSLGLVGIVDKGIYNPDETYNKGNFILHEGSTWLALKNNLQGVEPAEGESWKFLARGFAAEILSLITAVDSAGLVGNAGAETDGQTLLDAIADKVANQLLEKKMMSNVQVNDATMVPTSALVYAMQQALTNLNSNLTTRAMYVGYYLNNQWITILLKPNQTVLLTVNAFSQGNSVSNALYLIGGASGADKSGSILKLGGTFDLITNWNTGLSISINAAVDQWLQISALYL